MTGFSDLGDRIPAASSVGSDAAKDDWFDRAASLPDDLRDTDLVSLDADELARRGTFAYDVEYPLWSDNAGKSRHIHAPLAKAARDAAARPEPVRYDAASRTFHLPENARFYKTFLKAKRTLDGRVVYRPVETRVIVVRYPPREPLYGTYVWSDDGSGARLLKEPYRDGTPWRDHELTLVVDEAKSLTRNYEVPARHRCQECHMGGDNGAFVLGFTPVQVNRRAMGEGGEISPRSATS